LHPTLFKLGPIEISSYGLALAVSFVAGILVAARRARKYDIDPNRVMDLGIIVAISSIVGSRFLYVIFHLDEFRGHWLDTFNPFQSTGQIGIAGLTLLGGLLLAIFSGLVYLRAKKLSFLRFADVVIPSVALGILITRIGCFLNGCCYGTPTGLPWGVLFPFGSAAHYHYGGVNIHPAQLYSSLYGLVIFGALLLLEKHRKFDGFLFFLFLVLYGVARFLVDFVRYYESSMVIGGIGLSVNQGISLGMLIAGLILLIAHYKKTKPPTK
jgi:phosphatidylglycerol:prolipoprotein diacylglycerol transferase